ncbi:MAG: Asp-tRNA(Asn)/Glu-tRNA(Gln) amidotransferase subunit GatC [Myxococcales bacterium]|nr:MAG: Asp-tRNA(Asn)/Glu-tRNA(Gln) amidotransferase subunit GatC [Myxococcales bacterium]
MPIREEEVRRVAQLTRIALPPESLAGYARDLDRILDYMQLLNEADTRNVAPTETLFTASLDPRPDVVGPSLSREKALAATPETEDGQVRVPLVVGDD